MNPIDVQVSRVSAQGKLELTFTEELQFPENFLQLIKDRKCTKESILEIAMIDPYDQVNTNFKYW